MHCGWCSPSQRLKNQNIPTVYRCTLYIPNYIFHNQWEILPPRISNNEVWVMGMWLYSKIQFELFAWFMNIFFFFIDKLAKSQYSWDYYSNINY